MRHILRALFLVVAYVLGFAALASASGCAQVKAAAPYLVRVGACVVKCVTSAPADPAPAPRDGGAP